jgi:hypothetical protein
MGAGPAWGVHGEAGAILEDSSGEDGQPRPPPHGRQPLDEVLAVPVVAEDRAPPQPAHHEVMQDAGACPPTVGMSAYGGLVRRFCGGASRRGPRGMGETTPAAGIVSRRS